VADHEILEIAKTLRYDLTAMQAKLTELMRLAARLEAPDEASRTCPECGLSSRALPAATSLADHRWNIHSVEGVAS
jgi:hypothetical protein